MPQIPTGFKTYQTVSAKKSYILFKCDKCRKNNLQEYDVYGGIATYHALQGSQTKEVKMESAKQFALESLENNDNELFKRINEDQDYTCIGSIIMCKKIILSMAFRYLYCSVDPP